jgi:cell division protein FtsL
MGVVLVAIALAFGLAYRQNALVRLGYRADRLASELALLERQNGEREVQIASLGELGRVQRLAESRLGMVRPRSGVYLASGALGPAAQATGGAVALADGQAPPAALPGAAGSDLGAIGRLWRLLLRLTGNRAEAAGK